MSFVDFNNSPRAGVLGIAVDFPYPAFLGEGEGPRLGHLHSEPADNCAGNWESAWIDIGGEG